MIREVIYLDDNLVYRIYKINLDNITLDEYVSIFKNIDENYYEIMDIRFDNNYDKKISKELDLVKIKPGNYIDCMSEYIDKYVRILYKYDIDSEVSKIKNGNMLISYIKIYTLESIIEEIKKDA